ncbi:MAG: four helix bundle protein [Candidatus Methylacidiphilales bacterium]|nr:four helix bundle protein [Candidatus Methylacidiphilales bacterium]
MKRFAQRFEDLEIWQEARQLHFQAYVALESCRDFSFRDQMRRAALSVMNNIAEGFERHTSRDFAHFLDMAKGSCGEVRSMTYAAEDIRVLSESKTVELRELSEKLSKRIAAFTKHLRD